MRAGGEGARDDEMLDGISRHKFEQTLGDSEGQRSQACCSSWGHKELHTTERLNSNNNRKCRNNGKQLSKIPCLKTGDGGTSVVVQ